MSNPIDFEPPIFKFRRMSEDKKRQAQEDYSKMLLDRVSGINAELGESIENAQQQAQVNPNSLLPFTSARKSITEVSAEDRKKAQEEYNRRNAYKRF
jgi:hypothetical protein